MGKIIDNLTVETVSDAIRKEGFASGFADIAARMRKTAAAQGLTAEIFDKLIASPE